MNVYTIRKRSERRRRLAAAGLLALLGLGIMLYPQLTDIRYEYSQWRLGRATEAQKPENAEGSALPAGAVARIEIPAIDLQAFVLEGTGRRQLAQGPGHYQGTPLPGEQGNAAIAGHRTMHGHVFGRLNELRQGDRIFTGTAKTAAEYRVVELKVVDPGDTEVLSPTDDDRLTLTTCHPRGSAAKRLVVVAERSA